MITSGRIFQHHFVVKDYQWWAFWDNHLFLEPHDINSIDINVEDFKDRGTNSFLLYEA